MRKKPYTIVSVFEMLLIIGFALFAFRDLPFTFYQQDEWVSLGLAKIGGIEVELSVFPLHLLLVGLNRPFSTVLKYSLFHMFGTNVLPWAVFALFVHSINGLLVRKIARLLGIPHIFATVAGLSYAVCYASHQSVSWLATSFTALPSLFFMLLSIVLALKKKRIWCIVCAVISYYFKESSIAWMPLLPIFTAPKRDLGGLKDEFIRYTSLFIFIVFIIIVRIADIFIHGWKSQLAVTESSGTPMIGILINAFLYPLISFSETFIPLPVMRFISTIVFSSRYERLIHIENIHVVQELMMTDIVGLWCTLLLFIGMSSVLFFGKKYRFAILISFLLLVVSFIPFSLVNRNGEYLDSRYFSFAAAAGGLLISGLIASIVELSHKNKNLRLLVIVCISLFTVGYLYKQSVYIIRDIRHQKIIGEERKNMLQSVRVIYPDLPEKPVLYATGSAESFYGVSGMRLPLQQGPGFTFMVLFYDTGKIPKKLIYDMSFWGMLEQGYFEDGGQGFGYYHSLDLLKKDSCNNKFNSDQIRGFYYDSTDHKVIDITNDVVLRIRNCMK
ncbi:MAG: hypothetical protein UW22_C0001G0058 [Candidatus Gottesmanbacteria bacterium GW2011_GWB1_44_11c]|uniref:Glycosyltransferase RgtA/B/C/D-like domain-containing protein n=2 Tax=Candidatus Gottesmaniibacteriota TaxID=1752720 RepID=A0A0G1IR70_9BACT|nr:MAG: hypothetical protein UW22_C0001G0058 [Candidatus Gottesmanbacteria bacterium GW2011_GWB1_44_11c]KKT61620.1 MAG: hypothetical protein UW52_C0001G0058 [Candidatus Gottesmanbacteria bacterium GW2011_GWA1_44_24b]HCM82183.1 hypothetical protein [Patescibacteria group bacterium]